MPEVNEDRERQVVPRWRSFAAAAQFGELTSLKRPSTEKFSAKMLEHVLDDWKHHPGLSVASDLASVAFTLGLQELARDAAEFILSHQDATHAAKDIARRCLEPVDRSSPSEAIIEQYGQPAFPDIGHAIRMARTTLAVRPINPILWTNLSLFYTILGKRPKAEHAMRIALALAPENRFVLRAACRLYLHHGDAERAHDLLLRSSALKQDPWVLAGEVAIAAVRSKSSKHLKRARSLVDSQNYQPFDLSELSVAIATLEVENGSMKKARQLCMFSLKEPTENTLAQAGWLNRTVGGFHFSPVGPTRHSSEASAFIARASGEWDVALSEAKQWQAEQPFSSRPAILAANIASTVLEDYREAEIILRQGIQCNPDDATLFNNLAFALANQPTQEKLDEAAVLVRQGARLDCTLPQRVCLIATQGLIEFRRNRPEIGRLLYRGAIDAAAKQDMRLAAAAKVYYAIEELRISSAEAVTARKNAIDSAENLSSELRSIFLERLKKAEDRPAFA